MNWDKFDNHLENLITGVTLATIFVIFWPELIDLTIANKTLISTGFIATSYLTGAVANLIARSLISTISPWTLRAHFIKLFAKNRITCLDKKTKGNINKLYSKYIDETMMCDNEHVIKEILKRRQTGRLCRSALLPLILIVYKIISSQTSSTWLIVLGILCSYVFVLILYTYAEISVFSEASRGSRIFNFGNSTPKVEKKRLISN